MRYDFAPKLARVITEYSAPVRPGDVVEIIGRTDSLPFIEALLSAVLKRGGNPVINIGDPVLLETFVREANDEQFAWIDEHRLEFLGALDVSIQIGQDISHVLDGLPEERITKFFEGRRPFRQKNLGRVRSDPDYQWIHTVWPTQTDAQRTGIGLGSFTDYAYRACGLDSPDPIAHWNALYEKQSRLVRWLENKHKVEVKGPKIDLSFDITGRPWANYHGKHHMPDGEIFTCPIEDSVNGMVEFGRPQGAIEGVRLVFKNGEVVEHSARYRQDRLTVILNIDAGARRVGLFGIGTNTGITQYTGDILFDAKMQGTIHILLGQSMPEGGGTNRSSTQFVLIHDMRPDGEIHVDGELFFCGGQFMTTQRESTGA